MIGAMEVRPIVEKFRVEKAFCGGSEEIWVDKIIYLNCKLCWTLFLTYFKGSFEHNNKREDIIFKFLFINIQQFKSRNNKNKNKVFQVEANRNI